MGNRQLTDYTPKDAYDTIRGFFKDMGERATLEAYRKYAGQDKNLRDETLHIGEATVRLKWHKGRILGEMEKNEGAMGVPGNEHSLVQLHDVTTPTYSDLGINKMQASREQLVKKAFDEDRILDICAELIDKDQVPMFSYFLNIVPGRLSRLLVPMARAR